MKEEFPKRNQAYSVFIQEEYRTAITESSMANIDNQYRPPKKILFCEFCKGNGHEVSRCFKKFGYPFGWQRNNHDQ